jgi:hypothetical protein
LAANAFGQFGREFRGDYVDLGASVEEAGDFLGSDGAAADDEDSAVCEFQKCGEQRH